MNTEIVKRLAESFEGDPLTNALQGGDESARALRLIAAAMHLETAAEDGTPWSGDRGKAEAVQTAVQLIVAGIAGLPVTPPTIDYSDNATELRPSERGRQLARYLLERSNITPPTEKEQPK
jgi:hypothetical protein